MIPKIGARAAFTVAAIRQSPFLHPSATRHSLLPESSSHMFETQHARIREVRPSVANSEFDPWTVSSMVFDETNAKFVTTKKSKSSLSAAAVSAIPHDARRFSRNRTFLTKDQHISLVADRLLKIIMVALTLGINILDEKRMFLRWRPLQGLVSRLLFWPTLPKVAKQRFGSWVTPIDRTVVLGGAPIGFASIPEKLHCDFSVSGIINMCDEYSGPTKKYQQLGMRQLRLKTVNHFEPSVEDLKEGVAFLHEHEKSGKRAYVHCRAGNGRSAAIVFSWLLFKNPSADPEQLNQQLCKIRNVRKTLWKQPNIRAFHSWLKDTIREGNDANFEAPSRSR